MSTMTRKIKNVVRQYTFAEVKVREATSNDPWGPTVKQLDEIAELTFNNVAIVEILGIIWKRLAERGKNWRHVHKSLIVLDHLIKCGNEKVAQHSIDRMELIRSLLCYEFYDEGKDVGQTVRDKSKQILSLINDQDRLKNERTKMTNSRQVYAQNTAGVKGIASPPASEDLKNKKKLKSLGSPTLATSGSEEDEDLQLQLALAMSREEHKEEEKKKKMEEMRLQMALEESRRLYGTNVGDDDGSFASNNPDTEEVKPHKPLGQRLTLLSIATAQTSNHTPSPDDLLVSIGSDISKGNGAGPTDNVSDPWQDLALTLSPNEATGCSMPPDPWGQTSRPNNGISSLSYITESFNLLDINQSPSCIPWPAPSGDSNFGELSAFSDNNIATDTSATAWSNFPINNLATTGFPAAMTGFPAATTGFPAATTVFPAATTGFPAATTGFPSAMTGFTTETATNSTLFSPTNPFYENYLPQKNSVSVTADPWSNYAPQLTSDLQAVSQGVAYPVPPLPYPVSLPSSNSLTLASATPGFIPQPMPRAGRNRPANNSNGLDQQKLNTNCTLDDSNSTFNPFL